MAHKGKMTVHTDYTYRQCVCPLRWRKSLPQKFLACPVFHPEYFEQKGCNALIREALPCALTLLTPRRNSRTCTTKEPPSNAPTRACSR
jgi:hypothetical protein